jgi:DNA-binding CsgD family transcriptional regulator
MFDMRSLPAAASVLHDLTEQEQEVLRLVARGESPRDIATRLTISEDVLYRLVARVLDELAPDPDGRTMGAVHAQHGSRAAGQAEVLEFERRFGPSLLPDDEG